MKLCVWLKIILWAAKARPCGASIRRTDGASACTTFIFDMAGASACPVLAITLATMVTLAACAPQSHVNPPSQASLAVLPASLVNGPLTLSNILNVRNSLTINQLDVALRQLLNESGSTSQERQEASYILARLVQGTSNQANQNLALSLFETAKDFPALHELSEWHISEVATYLGQEKIVRKALQAVLDQTKVPEKQAAAQYALAQSYLRANENKRAMEALNKIRNDFPKTKFAVGAAYYLGEMALSKYDALHAHQHDQPNWGNQADQIKVDQARYLKEAISYFNEYLHDSPAGHFGATILNRLTPLIKLVPNAFSQSDLDLYAQAAYAQGHWQEALALWQRLKLQSRLMEIAACLAKLGSVDKARAQLLAALKHNPYDYRYVSVGQDICRRLNSDAALKFWRQIFAIKPKNSDAALWNIAMRSAGATAIPIYRELVSRYPSSVYAAESQWWVLWDMIEHKSGKDLSEVPHLADAAARRYANAKAAPRFLFWAGQVSERLANAEDAEFYYRKAMTAFPSDYYGYRSAAKFAALHKLRSAYDWSRHRLSAKLSNWQWPEPTVVIQRTNSQETEPFWELVHLKEYQEALSLTSDQSPELKAWLYAMIEQPRQAVNTASSQLLSEKPDRSPLWQYSYPLLYVKEIMKYCADKKNVDAYLMHALVREESRYNCFAVSGSKAIGLTQVMPATAYGVAKNLRIPVANVTAFFDPSLNLRLGTAYLSLSLSRFNNNPVFAIASYNGGAGAVQSWIKRSGTNDLDVFVENIPFRETREYVRKVFQSYWTYYTIYQKL